jgi:uncharacterized protein
VTEHTNDSVSASLLQAAFSGQTHVVRELLADRAAVNAQDDFENTALLLAALNGHVDIVRDLLDHGAAIDHRNRQGGTALFLAAGYPIRLAELLGRPTARLRGHDEVVRELLARGAATGHRNADNQTAIEAAAANGNVDAALDLLAHGAVFDDANDFERDPLRWAAARGYVAVVSALLDRGVSVTNPAGDGSTALTTALTWAVSQRRHAVTKVLLDHGAVVSKADRAMIDDWLLWLEAHAEEAYDKMYDAHNSTDAAGSYSNAKGYLDDALALAGRLELPEMVAWLEARLAHIKAVFRSQFSS